MAHPGAQHSYETALGLQQAGLLQQYVTGLYFKCEGTLARAVRYLPSPVRGEVASELRRRRKEGLDERLVKTLPGAELLYVSLARLGLPQRWASRLVTWRNGRFGEAVGRIARRERPLAVHCYDTAALGAFAQARHLGIFCILDQSIADMRGGLRILKEEAEVNRDFADAPVMDNGGQRIAALCDREMMMADLILTPSEYVRDGVVKAGIDPSRVVVHPYGADIDAIRPAEVQRSDGSFRVLFVGQIGPRKGIYYLLEAMRQLNLCNARLLLLGGVAGSGKGLERYRNHFTLIGTVPHHQVGKYFEQADIFVFPSLHEGSARVTYEALAAGLPVVTTPNSGSVVRDGIEGFIVPIRDVAALKEKILMLYENADLRKEMGRRARARAEEFSWTTYRERLGTIIQSRLLKASLN